jgi:hypothetical protein
VSGDLMAIATGQIQLTANIFLKTIIESRSLVINFVVVNMQGDIIVGSRIDPNEASFLIAHNDIIKWDDSPTDKVLFDTTIQDNLSKSLLEEEEEKKILLRF